MHGVAQTPLCACAEIKSHKHGRVVLDGRLEVELSSVEALV